jgi:hypothetical protein
MLPPRAAAAASAAAVLLLLKWWWCSADVCVKKLVALSTRVSESAMSSFRLRKWRLVL